MAEVLVAALAVVGGVGDDWNILGALELVLAAGLESGDLWGFEEALEYPAHLLVGDYN